MKFDSIAHKAAYWQRYAANDYQLVQQYLKAYQCDAAIIAQRCAAEDAAYARKIMGIVT